MSTSFLSTIRRRLGPLAVASVVVTTLAAATGSSLTGAAPNSESKGARHGEPVTGDPCGNLLLRRERFSPLPTPTEAVPDPRATVYSGINDRGQLVGGYFRAGATPDAEGFYPLDAHRAVVADRKGRDFRSIDVPGALITLAYALNDRAHVVGQYIDAGAVPDDQGRLPAGTVHGFLWHRGVFTTVDFPGAPLTQPLGINNRGVIVGAYLDAVADPDDPYAYYDTGRLRGFVLRDGTYTPLDFPGGVGTKVSAINDRGQMAGYYDTDTTRRGFLLSKGRFTRLDYPGSPLTLPSGIDGRGRVVGAYLDPNGINGRGFLWKNGRYTPIVAPGNRTDSIALAINDKGASSSRRRHLLPATRVVRFRPDRVACSGTDGSGRVRSDTGLLKGASQS